MAAIIRTDLETADVNFLDAARVNGNRRRILCRSADHGNAACSAKMLPACCGAPAIGAEESALVLELDLLRRDIPMEEPAPQAERAVAFHNFVKFGGDLQLNISAVARNIEFGWPARRRTF